MPTLSVIVRTHGQSSLHELGQAFRRASRDADGLNRTFRDTDGRLRDTRGRFASLNNTVGQSTSRMQHLRNSMRQMSEGVQDAAIQVGKNLLPALLKWGPIVAFAAGAVMQLTVAAVNLAGLVQLLAPAAIAAALAFGTLKMALNGVGDAIKAGLSGDAEEFDKALKKLTPSARDFAKSAVGIVQAWRPVKAAVQEAFFGAGDLAHEIRQLSIEYQPLAQTWLPKIAAQFSLAAKAVADFLEQPDTKNQIGLILFWVNEAIGGILRMAKPLTQAFLDIATVAAPSLADMANSAGNLAEKFAAWIRHAKESGKLHEWLEKGKQVLGKIVEIAEQVGRIFGSFFKDKNSQKDAIGFLDNIKKSLKALADWLNSENGQSFIKTMKDFAKAVANVGVEVEKMSKRFHEFAEWLRGLRRDVTGFFTALSTVASLSFGSLFSGGMRAFSWTGFAGGLMNTLSSVVRNIATNIGNALGSIGTGGLRGFSFIPGVIGQLGGLSGVARSVASGISGALSGIFGAGQRAFAFVGGAMGQLSALADRAWSVAGSIRGALSSIPARITTYVDIIHRTFNVGGDQGFARSLPSNDAIHRAAGGPVRAGQPYIVGETRPELFVPRQDGYILPRVPTSTPTALGGGGGPVQVQLVGGSGGGPLAELLYQMVSRGELRLKVVNNRVVTA